MTKVIISRDAFTNIVVSAVEVHAREAMGALLGSRRKNTYFVKEAYGFQSAERKPLQVKMKYFREKRINNCFKYLSRHNVIGDFHSHPGGYEKLTVGDERDIESFGKNFVSILVVLKKTKRIKLWKFNKRDKSISGSIGEKFFVKIKAFEWDEDYEKVFPVKVECPYMKNVNKTIKHYKKMKKKLKKMEKKSKEHEKLKLKLKRMLP